MFHKNILSEIRNLQNMTAKKSNSSMYSKSVALSISSILESVFWATIHLRTSFSLFRSPVSGACNGIKLVRGTSWVTKGIKKNFKSVPFAGAAMIDLWVLMSELFLMQLESGLRSFHLLF